MGFYLIFTDKRQNGEKENSRMRNKVVKNECDMYGESSLG